MTPKIRLEKEHPKKIVRRGEEEIEIDLQIWPLIKVLWDQGIETLYCCQGDDPKFPSKYGSSEGYILTNYRSFPSLLQLLGVQNENINKYIKDPYRRRRVKIENSFFIEIYYGTKTAGPAIYFKNEQLDSLYACVKRKSYDLVASC